MYKGKGIWFVAVLALGATSIITQTILLREFLNLFRGNELVIGIILANWMLITGLGAYTGKIIPKKANKKALIVFLLVLLSVLPLGTAFLLNYLRNIVFTIGTMTGLLEILGSSFVLMLPYCLASGILFNLFSTYISGLYNKNLISRVYAIESLGSLAGGILFNLGLIYFFKTFQSLIILMAADLTLLAIVLFKNKTKAVSFLIIPVALVGAVILWQLNLTHKARQFLYPNQEIIFQQNTPYGNIVITKQEKQLNFYENNNLIFSTNDKKTTEEAIHYPLTQVKEPDKVLLIGGGIMGTIEEALKYAVKRIDYVEINPYIIDIGKKYTSQLNHQCVNVINQDARLYFKQNEIRYDAIIIGVPPPTTAELNRYYTTQFFGLLKKHLKDSGIVSFSVMSTANYVGQEAAELYSILYQTVRKHFANVMIVAGSKNYFLASNRPLHYNFVDHIHAKNIQTSYINKYYLDERGLKQKSQHIMQRLIKDVRINKEFTPIAYFKQISYWLSYFNFKLWIFGGLIMLITLAILIISRKNPYNTGIFSSGLAASAMQIVILLAFQVTYGYVYHMIGIFIMLFMGGMALGALYRHKIIKQEQPTGFIALHIGIGVFSMVIPFILILFKHIDVHIYLLHAIFFIITFMISAITGMLFNLASRLQQRNVGHITGEIYSIDLWGAAIGSLLASAFLIPLLGIIFTSLIVGGINIMVAGYNKHCFFIK